MNPDIKAKWLEALRSGKYKQGTGALRYGDAFCCLGVLCDVSKQGTWLPIDNVYDPDAYRFVTPDGSDARGVLSLPMKEWSSLGHELSHKLISMNDAGHSFAEIADVIEREA